MGRLCVRLFGRFDAGYEDQPGLPARPLRGLDARKPQECLSYLLLHRNRVFPREILAELIAPEMPTEQSRKGLRQVLWQLQNALGPTAVMDSSARDGSSAGAGVPDPERPLVVDAEWVYVNPSCPLWLDVAQLDDLFGRLVGQPGETLSAEAAQQIRCVAGLYKGDLLEGWYYEWCLLERERLQSAYLALLDKLMAYSTAHAEYEAGLVYGQTILAHDRARERTHQRMMHLHWLLGDRTGALRQYHACSAALQEELGVSPSRRTTELYEHIASGEAGAEEGPRSREGPSRGLPAGLRNNKQAPAPPPDARAPDARATGDRATGDRATGDRATGDRATDARLRASFLNLARLQRQVNRQMAELNGLLGSDPSASASHTTD